MHKERLSDIHSTITSAQGNTLSTPIVHYSLASAQGNTLSTHTHMHTHTTGRCTRKRTHSHISVANAQENTLYFNGICTRKDFPTYIVQ